MRARCGHDGAHRIAHARAFSLTELIVVIAVAVLLTGLLMPAMRLMHEQAHKVICMSNLGQVGQAMFLYGEDYNDRLPYSHALHQDNAPHNLMVSRSQLPVGWDGIGRLFAEGYCTAPDCFYCPSHHGHHPREKYIDHWYFNFQNTPIFTNFQYAGDIEWNVQGSSKLRSLLQGHDLVLATDGLRSKLDFNHRDGFNVLRADGSVRYKDDHENVYERLASDVSDTTVPANFGEIWNDVITP